MSIIDKVQFDIAKAKSYANPLDNRTWNPPSYDGEYKTENNVYAKLERKKQKQHAHKLRQLNKKTSFVKVSKS